MIASHGTSYLRCCLSLAFLISGALLLKPVLAIVGIPFRKLNAFLKSERPPEAKASGRSNLSCLVHSSPGSL